MTPATSQSPKNFRQQIGSALWLWELLVNLIPNTWDGKAYVFVAGGQVLSDSQLAIWLDAKVSTIAAWRRRLRAAGILDWSVKPGVGRVYVVSPLVGKDFFNSEKTQLTPETKQVKPQPLEIRRPDNKPLASRFVQ
jgi:hypothetical protein